MKGDLVVEHLTKSYFSYGKETRRVLSWFGLPFKPVHQTDVLQDVTFKIGPGESVGIVGQNGAGKSTLLKIITGTTSATSGRVLVQGQVSAILELGMGFNGEFTGRENAFHAATLMGREKAEIAAVMPWIHEFSEIGDYFDQPIRTYSSGMQMRVAFAVATAFRPDFLIVDEALAVGDAYFQHKSYARISEFQKQGTTLLFVSHDRNAVINLCRRAILLDRGRLISDGKSDEVLDYYNALLAEREDKQTHTRVNPTAAGHQQTVSGSGEATVLGVRLCDEVGQELAMIGVGQRITLEIQARANQDIPQLILGYSIRDKFGQIMYGTNTFLKKKILRDVKQGDVHTFKFAFDCNLGVGDYSISSALVSSDTHLEDNYEWREFAHVFSVVNRTGEHFAGINWLDPAVKVE